jgi:hypothetical protein
MEMTENEAYDAGEDAASRGLPDDPPKTWSNELKKAWSDGWRDWHGWDKAAKKGKGKK